MQKIERLSNGLRIITQSMKDRESASIGIWVGVGGRYEDDRVKGATHFLEHIVFKGSEKYTCESIKESIEGVGGTLNAFTSEEQTCFYAKIPAAHINKTFDVLADMVFFPNIKASDVRKERTVIIEEIKMYHDLPQYFVLELLDGLIWPDHPLGKQLAGTIDSVSGLSSKDLKRFHHSYYRPGNIAISACGKIDHDAFVRMAKRKLGKIKSDGEFNYLPITGLQSKARVNFYRKDIEQMHLALGMPGYDENHPDRHTLGLLSIIMGGNMSSRLFEEVREKKGLAYSIGTLHKTMHDTGVFMVRAGVDNQKIVSAVGLILKEFRKIRKNGVTAGEFKRAKDYMLGQILLGLEDSMEHMLWLGESMIARDRGRSIKDVIKALNKIKIADIQRVARDILDEKRYNLAIVGPVTDQQDTELRKLLDATV